MSSKVVMWLESNGMTRVKGPAKGGGPTQALTHELCLACMPDDAADLSCRPLSPPPTSLML